ncbi:MAG: tetratricopeptide repeat protein [Planctomycetota bacterium]
MRKLLLLLVIVGGAGAWLFLPADDASGAKSFARESSADAPPAPAEAEDDAPYWAEAENAVAGGELERGQALLEGYLEREAPAPEVFELLSTIARRSGDASTAVAYAESAIELAPERGEAYVTKTRALQQRIARAGRLQAMMSIGDLKRTTARAVELAPNSVQALVDRGHFFLYTPGLAGGDADAVPGVVERLAALDPVQSIALDVARLHRADRFDDALALCRAGLAEHPEGQELHLLLGRLLNETDDVAGAEAAFRAALSGPADEPRFKASYKLAKILIQAERGYDEAVGLLNGFLDGLRRCDVLNTAAAAHWWIGRAHEAWGHPEKARASYEEALRNDDDFDQARESLEHLDA